MNNQYKILKISIKMLKISMLLAKKFNLFSLIFHVEPEYPKVSMQHTNFLFLRVCKKGTKQTSKTKVVFTSRTGMPTFF